jgi:uncharacterized membrane protein
MDQMISLFSGGLGLTQGGLNQGWLPQGLLGKAHSGGTHLILPGFDEPAWLVLIAPLLVWCWWVARRSLSGGSPTRQLLQLGVRCLVVVLLCAALAQPRVRWRANDVAVMTVLDVSASIPSDQQRVAREFLSASLDRRVSSDRFGIVTVAREPLVQSLATSRAPTADVSATGDVNATDLRRGLELARGLLPADAAGRILLISDGNATTGSIQDVVSAAAVAGVPIDVAAVSYDRSDLVSVREVSVPAWVRDGDTINARVVLNAGQSAAGRLTLLLNGEAVDLDADSPALSKHVELEPGLNVLTVPIALPRGPVHRVQAIFENDEPDAGIPETLKGEGVTFTSDHGRVLILSESESESGPLARALESEGNVIEVRSSEMAPTTLTEWSGFDAVVVMNEPASNFTLAQQDAMVQYVHDVGGGLLFLGGPDSFGAGGWIGSSLAEALPVSLDPPQKRQMPLGALAIIIDKSGSMSAGITGTTITQQQAANEAAILGVQALSRLDQAAIIAFSDGADVVMPLSPVGDGSAMSRRIRSIGPGGGTNLFPAIDAAAAELAKSPGGVKHIIILTDGQTIGDPNEGIAKAAALRKRGISISAVAIGDSANDPLLARLAQASDGRFYRVSSKDTLARLPKIFVKEAQVVRRSLIWEGPGFSPTRRDPSDALRGVGGTLPLISGYVVTADRGGLSNVPLRGPENDPILAQWQYGLGRVVAYTSDATARWNGQWLGWEQYGTFWRQHLKWAMRPAADVNARVSVDASSEPAKVVLELFNPSGDRANFAQISARAAPPPGDHAGDSREITFRQAGPGRYEAEVEASVAGTSLLSLRYAVVGDDGEPRVGSARAAIVRKSGAEYREPEPSTNAMWELARATNGRIYRLEPGGADLWVREGLKMPEISQPAWLLVAAVAIGMFLVDVAARRIAIDWFAAKSRVVGLISPAKTGTSASLGTLAAAKARAGASMQERASVRPHEMPRRRGDHAAEGLGGEADASPSPLTPRPRATQPNAPITPIAPKPGPALTPNQHGGSDGGSMMERLRAAKARGKNDG